MIAKVQLWGRTIGAVSLDEGREVAAFQYDADFARSGIELSPLVMPLSERVYAADTVQVLSFLPGWKAGADGGTLSGGLVTTGGQIVISFSSDTKPKKVKLAKPTKNTTADPATSKRLQAYKAKRKKRLNGRNNLRKN